MSLSAEQIRDLLHITSKKGPVPPRTRLFSHAETLLLSIDLLAYGKANVGSTNGGGSNSSTLWSLYQRGLLRFEKVSSSRVVAEFTNPQAALRAARLLARTGTGQEPSASLHRVTARACNSHMGMSSPIMALASLAVLHASTDVARIDLPDPSFTGRPDSVDVVVHKYDGSITDRSYPLLGEHESHALLRQTETSLRDYRAATIGALLWTVQQAGHEHLIHDPTLNLPTGPVAKTLDLDLWEIRPLGHTPTRRYSETLPATVQDALDMFGAPPLLSPEHLVHWVEQHLRISLLCGPKHKGRKRHHVHINPHDRSTRSTASGHDPEGLHTLLALQGVQPIPCDGVDRILNQRIRAHGLPGEQDGTTVEGFSFTTCERILAARDLTNAVSYLDAGWDLHRTAHLLRERLTVSQAHRVMRAPMGEWLTFTTLVQDRALYDTTSTDEQTGQMLDNKVDV